MRFLSISTCELGHHFFKFLKINKTIAVKVDLLYNFVPHCRVFAHVVAENLSHFLSRDGTSSITVKHLKCLLQVLFVQKNALVNSCRAPLTKVNVTVLVHICSLEEGSSLFVNFLGLQVWVHFLVGTDEFV